jgi:hypothetical protein
MAKQPRKPEKKKTVETHTHEEASRKNIPTAEFQSVMRKEEQSPIRVAYERRNRDLDPQLVWRGKDEQDWSDLVTHAPPLYIQEKVHPKVLIDDLLRRSKADKKGAEDQIDLFADFNGLPDVNAKTEFYQHDANWSNRMILGDSLQVMASLAEREGLRGQVQCIYIDPPYGIKFNSNFQWSTTSRVVKDGNTDHITREPEQVKAFRDTWRNGIHSYLAYLRDRLTVARDLLTESGSIFFQIGDENLHLVRSLLDEIFGSENFCMQIVFAKASAQSSDLLPGVNDYLLWYARDKGSVKYRPLFTSRAAIENPSERTGKTIVALHRAVFLSRSNPDARVLLTTFSEALSNALGTKLRRLIGNEPRLGERLEVHSTNAIGRRLYELNIGRPQIAPRETIRQLLKEGAEGVDGNRLSHHFLATEWQQVVDAWRLETWEAYRDVVRLGRKTRLKENQRAGLWSIFERVRSGLKTRGLITESDLFSRLALKLKGSAHSPFDFIVVDEAQDVGVAQLRFLAALGAGGPNSLFFAGDLGQRIFQQPFSWKALGVDVRGRSSTLRINYRTSHQIRTQADRLLGPECPTSTAIRKNATAQFQCSTDRRQASWCWIIPKTK